ncbi:MAG: type I restriction enzyme HsdR N-terminal domain-containing protein [Cytophagaceae bacterium]|nr:type I restriction enzyme HsdR N-terminal domain-containing protein [Cytophagaceae bacterium]
MNTAPSFTPHIIEKNGKKQIFDPIRKRFVALTPEESVRQMFIDFMVRTMKYPAGLIGVEKSVSVNGMCQRADILLYNRRGEPVMIVECKAPNVAVGRETLEQAARYNTALGVKYLTITNGQASYCVQLGAEANSHQLLAEFPPACAIIN